MCFISSARALSNEVSALIKIADSDNEFTRGLPSHLLQLRARTAPICRVDLLVRIASIAQNYCSMLMLLVSRAQAPSATSSLLGVL